MLKEAYQSGVLQALNDAGITKTASPNPGRMARLIESVNRHPEAFGALGGAGLGAGTTALGGGDIDDVLLGTGIGAFAGGAGGVGMRSARNSKALQAIRDRLSRTEAEMEMTAAGVPQISEAELVAAKDRMRAM